MTIQDVANQVGTHNDAAGSHSGIVQSLQGQINGLTARDVALQAAIDALSASGGLSPAPYSATATYSLGSANSLITHANNLLVYIHTTELSSNHDPALHPNYWGNLSDLASIVTVDNTTNTHFFRGQLIVTHEDEVYLCATNAQAATARSLQYVKDNSGIGGEFVNLTDKIPNLWKGEHTSGTFLAGSIVKVTTGNRIVHYQASVDTSETPPHADWAQLSYPDGIVSRENLPPVREWTLNDDYKKGEIVDTTGTNHLHFIALVENNSRNISNRKQPGTPDGVGTWDRFYTVDNPPTAGTLPPSVKIINATAFTSGSSIDLTVTNWRNYKWLQILSNSEGQKKLSAAVSTEILNDEGDLEIPVKQNDELHLTRTSSSDVINFAPQGWNAAAGETITVWGIY